MSKPSLEKVIRNNLEADYKNNKDLCNFYNQDGRRELAEYHKGRSDYALKILKLMDEYNTKSIQEMG